MDASTRKITGLILFWCAATALLSASCWKKPYYTPRVPVRPSTSPIPVLLAVTPVSGPASGGTTLLLYGSDFRPGARVFFGEEEAPVLQVQSSSLSVTSLPGVAGSVDVRVVNDDGTNASVEGAFTYVGGGAPVPEIMGASLALGPDTGAGEFLVWGRNFAEGATVSVGGVPCLGQVVHHGGLILAVAPAGPAGPSDIGVLNPGGISAVLTGGYSYVTLGSARGLVLGRAEFEKRQVLDEGLSGSAFPAPIPFAHVEFLVGPDPPVVLTLSTDPWGYYCQDVDADTPIRVRVCSRSAVPPASLSVLVMDNATDQVSYAMESSSFTTSGNGYVRLDLLAPAEGPARIAGAFNLLSECSRASRRVQDTLNLLLPPLRVFWEPGNAAYISTSGFYTKDFGSGPVPAIQILGGLIGAEEFTDTDEFDDHVVVHEYGHYVQHAVSTDSSPGGRHGGERLVPNLAFSEGFATWFACTILGDSMYRDTVGRGDWGYVGVDMDGESVAWQLPLVKGIGSEETVLEILWDLFDGPTKPGDRDADGQELGFAPVLGAVASFDPSADYPSLYTLLDALVTRGDLTVAKVDALTHAPEEQGVPYPPSPSEAFPRELDAGVPVTDFVDARRPYHPGDPSWKFWLSSTGGNPYNPANGYNSRRYYRFTLTAEAPVTLTLDIAGSGESPENLDLYLLNPQNGVLASSTGSSHLERIQGSFAPGTYIVEVRGFYETSPGYIRMNAANFVLMRD